MENRLENMKYYLTGKQAQAVDKYTQETLGIPGLTLMESAAKKLAEAIDDAVKNSSEYAKHNKCYEKLMRFDETNSDSGNAGIKILSVVESGNNGGDAVAAAWMLRDMGYETYIAEINGIVRKTESYLAEIEKAKEHGVTFLEDSDQEASNIKLHDLSDYDIIIDGIFGVGLTRDVKGIQKEYVDKINGLSAEEDNSPFVVGVDIPSGICADNGHILGTAVKCDMTVTFEYIKYGMLVNEGRTYSGNIRCEHIGLYVPDTISQLAEIFNNEKVGMLAIPENIEYSKREAESIYINYEYEASDIGNYLPERKADSNKGTYGKVLIIAGSKEIYGAVYMAAEAAYRVGAGLVKVVTDVRNRDVLCDKLPEAMLLTYDTDNLKCGFKKKSFDAGFAQEFSKSVHWADVILCGPGLGTGDASRKLMDMLADSLSEEQKLILDADALNIISSDGEGRKPADWFKLFTSKTGLGNVIITPHMMEMLRLVKAGYDKKTFEFMMDQLGKGSHINSEMDFLKEYKKAQSYNMSYDNGIITVLKDARTFVTFKNTKDDAPGREGYLVECPIYINTTGNSGMSKGGSGDVLAGMIAGLLAGNRAGKCTTKDVVCAAVHLHGRAGDLARDRLGERSMLARDILDAVPDVLKDIN